MLPKDQTHARLDNRIDSSSSDTGDAHPVVWASGSQLGLIWEILPLYQCVKPICTESLCSIAHFKCSGAASHCAIGLLHERNGMVTTWRVAAVWA